MRYTPTVALDALARVARAGRGASPDAVFSALDGATRATIGHKLFTLMVFHADAGETERIYTNQPGSYPVGGRKRFADTAWSRRVLREGTPYVGTTAADIREVFPDHELIASLGCASVLNVPVMWNGRVLGTMNLLHEEGWYFDADVPLGLTFATALVPVYLARLGGDA
jgi:hypothetical protein